MGAISTFAETSYSSRAAFCSLHIRVPGWRPPSYIPTPRHQLLEDGVITLAGGEAVRPADSGRIAMTADKKEERK